MKLPDRSQPWLFLSDLDWKSARSALLSPHSALAEMDRVEGKDMGYRQKSLPRSAIEVRFWRESDSRSVWGRRSSVGSSSRRLE